MIIVYPLEFPDKIMKLFIRLLLFVLPICAFTQFQIKDRISWNYDSINLSGNNQIPTFENAVHFKEDPSLSLYTTIIDLPSEGTIQANLTVIKEEHRQIKNSFEKHSAFKEYKLTTRIVQERKQFKVHIELLPLQFISSNLLNLISEFEINLNFTPNPLAKFPPPPVKFISELSEGVFHKIAVEKKGIYKIDKTFLETNLKLNVKALDPRNIRIFGNGGTRLPEGLNKSRVDDLQENKIFVSGENDGVFDDQDYILFYASGPDGVSYDELSGTFKIDKNPYSTKSFYFIKIDKIPGARIQTTNTGSQATYFTQEGMEYFHHESELINLLDKDECNHGTGQVWYGEELSNTRELNISTVSLLDNIRINENCKIKGEFATRSSSGSSLKINFGSSSKSFALGASSFSCTSTFAANNSFLAEYSTSGDLSSINVTFPNTSVSSEGWLNYITLSYLKNLNFNNKPIWIFDPKSKNQVSSYQINSNSNNLIVWDITDPLSVQSLNTIRSNNSFSFVAASRTDYSHFIGFNLSSPFEQPEFIGLVENQNIHSIDKVDLVIVYPSSLKSEAERLLKHRTTHSKLTGVAVDIQQIYNEFGSGSKDPTALRDFAKMLYDRTNQFKYLILFGTASYDFRHLAPNTSDFNLVPTYETKESLDPINGYPSDDYFGLLDNNEGEDLIGSLDVEIGRILARNPEDATSIIDKIVKYDTDPKIYGDWKLNLLFIADDEDGNAHIGDVEKLAIETSSNKIYNQQKIYLDAYEQISTPGGERYPEVNKAIIDEIFRGSFIYCYLGHGGPTGLAQERIMQENDIRNWDNENKPPLMITATCSFTPFDDPKLFSAGQQTQIQKNGTIALYSTVRAVYANENYNLTRYTLLEAFKKTNNKYPTLGDILRIAKNKDINSSNNRKYCLFGDPSQTLAYPILKAEISSVNGKVLSTQDTFKALQNIQIKGRVKAEDGSTKQDFNGKIYITIYDKAINLKTRGNNSGSAPFNFTIQRNIIFKGISEVINGEWTVEFIIPKDINYEVGYGKISLYATNEKDLDAAGYSDQFIIGGFEKNTNSDDKPPLVKAFINNNEFVNGGICNENPKIYAEISDDFGINITGNSIGHDLVAILDGNDQNPIVLNTFFKGKLNSSKEGNVEYPLKNLSVGKHILNIVAWDISNNRGLGSIEFNVISSDDVNIEQVYNYPNPFSRKTQFQFETNYINIPLDITVQIQSLSGKIVKTIQEKITPTGYRITGIEWDGRDDNGSELANGVYLYRIGLHHSSSELILTQKSDYQKLLILK